MDGTDVANNVFKGLVISIVSGVLFAKPLIFSTITMASLVWPGLKLEASIKNVEVNSAGFAHVPVTVTEKVQVAVLPEASVAT